MILTGFFDNLMVAQLGYVNLASAGICNSIFFLVAVFPMGITLAFSTITGIMRGKKRVHIGGILFRDALFSTLTITAVSIAVLFLLMQNFHWFGQEEAVNQLSIPYFQLLIFSIIPMLWFFFVKSLADGYDFTQGGMIITILSLALNILLNYIFIYGNWGAPKLGLNGAGVATILSRLFSAVAMTILFFRNKRIPIYWIDFIHSFRRKSFNFYRQIIRLGVPTGLQYFFEVAAFAVAAILAGWLGAKELAAHQLAITIAALTYMFASGISSGTSIHVATSYGNKNRSAVRAYGNASLKLSIGLMLFFALVFAIFRTPIAAMFAEDQEVIALGSSLLLLAALFQLSDGIQAVGLGLLRGIEDVKIPSLITFMAYWLIAIPLGYYLGFINKLGVNGIWYGLAVGLSVSALFLTLRFYYLSRHINP